MTHPAKGLLGIRGTGLASDNAKLKPRPVPFAGFVCDALIFGFGDQLETTNALDEVL